MYTYRKIIVTIWIIFAAVMGYFAFQMPDILKGSGFEMADSSYADTNKLLEDEFGQSSSPYIILFEKPANVSKKDFQQDIQNTLDHIKDVKGIGSIASPLENESQYKEQIAYAAVSFDKKHDDASTASFT